jgi:orotate phosphoribosyltransferase
MQDQVARLLPKREGHFVFESGHHGALWLDLERLALQPEKLRPLVEALAARLRPHRAEAICAPLVEGAFVGLMISETLGLPFTYSLPTRDASATGLFPVSYAIPKPLERELAGKRVAVVNDVTNAGSAVRGTLLDLRRCSAQPVVIGSLAVYGDSASALAASHGAALETLVSFPSLIFEPTDCPLCAKGVPFSDSTGAEHAERLMRGASLVPELYVSRLPQSLHFYVELLGFTVDYARPEERFASLVLAGARLMLEETRSLELASGDELAGGEFRTAALRAPFGRGLNLELRVPDVEAVARRLAAADYPMLLAPYEKSYRVGAGSLRVRQLLVADPDGYLIRPSQVLESHA